MDTQTTHRRGLSEARGGGRHVGREGGKDSLVLLHYLFVKCATLRSARLPEHRGALIQVRACAEGQDTRGSQSVCTAGHVCTGAAMKGLGPVPRSHQRPGNTAWKGLILYIEDTRTRICTPGQGLVPGHVDTLATRGPGPCQYCGCE